MEIKVQVPSKLGEIRLDQYVKYLDILDQYDKIKDDSNAEIFYLLKSLEIFTGINYEDGLKLRLSDVKKIVSTIESLLLEKPKLIKRFKLGDLEFGFIPKLDDMTFGEYVDLDTNISNWKNMHKCMAVLYRPVLKKIDKLYMIEEYRGDNYYEAMKLMPLDAVFSSLLFFYRLGMDLSKNMTKYLESNPKELDSIQAQTLRESGVGINRSIHLLKEMLQDIKP